jgi:glycosyltransferase involved in cell wall biosynthesis
MHRFGLDHRLTGYRTGGIGTYVRRLAEGIAKLDPPEQVTVFFSRREPIALAPGVFIRGTLWTPCHHRFERLALSMELFPHRLDVFHSPDFIPPLWGARRHIITVHDLAFLHYPEHLTAESRRYYNDQIQAAVQQADHILTDSDSTRVDLMDMLNVPTEKITVHRLGVDPLFSIPDKPAVQRWRTELSLPNRYWLFVGTFEPRKNIRGLLDAYALIRASLPDAPSLVIAGNRGWLFEETLAYMETLGLRDAIRLIERVPQDALPTLYHEAIAVVSPSFYEGFGFPALEGMACGTVPIVSNRSSLPEVVGDVGLQVEPEDVGAIASAMRLVYEDTEFRSRQILNGRERARLFTWEHTAQIALETYRSVL